MDHLRFPVLSSRLYIVFDTVDTCTVDKKTCNVDNLLRKLNDIVQLIILQFVLDCLGILLKEIQAKVKEAAGMDLAYILSFLTHKFQLF